MGNRCVRSVGGHELLRPHGMPYNCAVLERTGDGDPVGRCWRYMVDGRTCPKHGDTTPVEGTK